MSASPGAHTPPSAVRHQLGTLVRARELHAAGWSLSEIRRRLELEGVTPPPAENTIWTWTRPKAAARLAEARNRRIRLARLGARTFAWPGVRGPEWRLEYMRRLRAAGLSYRAIAGVMALHFPDRPLSEYAVRELLLADRARPVASYSVTEPKRGLE